MQAAQQIIHEIANRPPERAALDIAQDASAYAQPFIALAAYLPAFMGFPAQRQAHAGGRQPQHPRSDF